MRVNDGGLGGLPLGSNNGNIPTPEQNQQWGAALQKYAAGQTDSDSAATEILNTINVPVAEGTTSQDSLLVQLNEQERKIRYNVLKELMKLGDDKTDKKVQDQFAEENILYDVPDGVEAADVDPYWNAENTSQRLVDFALSFRGHFSHLDDVEYIEEIRAAMLEGYARAHEDMGFTDATIPSDLAKLYNDTYYSTMDKIDTLLVSAKDEKAKE